MTKLDWNQHEGFDGAVWCADGDGIVAVYANGVYFDVREQGDHVATYIALDTALERAEQILHADYPAIYADCLA